MNTRSEPGLGPRKLYLEALREAVRVIADIDEVLASKFGGKGRGIHSKLDSVRPAIPTRLDRRLRYLEAARNKALAEREWRIPDHESFIIECQEALVRLRSLSRRREQRRHLWWRFCRLLGTGGSFAFAVAAMGLLLLLASGTVSLVG